MNTFHTQFKSDGFWFDQLERERQIALFEKTKGRAVTYEVVKIQKRKAWRAFGRDFPASEAMPPSERWGIDGWTYADFPSAMTRFQDQVRLQKARALRCGSPENRGGTLAPPEVACGF